MPLYEFICDDCGKSFETIVKYSETPSCEFCGSAKVQRQLSIFATYTPSSDIPSCAQGGCSGFNGGACGSGMCGCNH